MKNSLLVIIALLSVAGTAYAQSPAPAPAPVAVKAPTDDLASFTVLAEPQLMLPMTELTRLYSLRRSVTMLTAFDDSPTQSAKLLDGESGDVLITSYPTVISDLKQRGLVDVYSQTTVTSDSLVLAAKQNDSRDDRRELLAALETQPVLLANPEQYVEGLYGRQTLQYLYYNKAIPVAPVVYNSRSTMYNAIRTGDGIGVLLSSEAKHLTGIDLMVPLAETSHPPIIYQAMVVAGENMPIARDFTEFLRSSEAQRIFKKYGFTQP